MFTAAVAFTAAARSDASCSSDSFGRGSRFVARMDYGPRWYVAPAPGGTFSFDFSFAAGYWLAATSACEEWHLRIQPELALDLGIVGNQPVEVRGGGGVTIGAAALVLQLGYFFGGAYGTVLSAPNGGFLHGPRFELFAGVAGFTLVHGYYPRAGGDVHSMALHGMVDVIGAVRLFMGIARWAR